MAPNLKLLEPRINRLLRQEFHAADLHHIFLQLREYNFYRRNFLEVGHFLAHQDRREKGFITDRIRKVVAGMLFCLSEIIPDRPKRDYDKDEMRRVFAGNFQLMGRDKIAATLGVSPNTANSMLPRLLKELHGHKGGVVQATFKRDGQLHQMYNALHFIDANAFCAEKEIYEEFIYVLTRNKVLLEEDIHKFDYLKIILPLFAIASMNGSRILMEDGSEIPVVISYGIDDLGVMIKVPFHDQFMQVHLYATSLKQSEFLVGTPDVEDFMVELRDDGKLHVLNN